MVTSKTIQKNEYKKTTIGDIPFDWNLKSLESLCESNGLIRGPFGGSLKKEYFTSSGYKVYEQRNAIYKSADIGDYYITEAKFKELERFKVKTNDFIVSCSGTIGEIYQIPCNHTEGIINQALLKITINSNIINQMFFLKYFEWREFKKRIIDNTQGGAMQNMVGMPVFRKILIPVPPKEEQQKIATALSDTDNLIESLEKIIDKKEKIKQGTMQQLLTGKKRLPGFDEEWENIKLGEIIDFINGKAHEKAISEHGEFVVVNSRFISTEGKVIRYTNVQYCPTDTEDILMVMSDVPNGRAIAKCYYVEKGNKYTVNQRVCIMRTKKTNSKFLFYLLDRNPYFLSFDDGAKQTNLSKDDVLNCPLRIPIQLEEQQAIAEILSDMDAEIEALEDKLEKYKKLKEGMMQELLTGRIRFV